MASRPSPRGKGSGRHAGRCLEHPYRRAVTAKRLCGAWGRVSDPIDELPGRCCHGSAQPEPEHPVRGVCESCPPRSRQFPAVAGRGKGWAPGPSRRDPKGPFGGQDSRHTPAVGEGSRAGARHCRCRCCATLRVAELPCPPRVLSGPQHRVDGGPRRAFRVGPEVAAPHRLAHWRHRCRYVVPATSTVVRSDRRQ